MKNASRIDYAAISLALYVSMFTLYRPLWVEYPSYSGVVLLFSTGALLAVSLIAKADYVSGIPLRAIGMIAGVVTLLMLEMLLRYESAIIGVLTDFISFGAVPILMASKVTSYRHFSIAFGLVELLAFFIFFRDPFNDFLLTGDYMGFGLGAMLPAFIGMAMMHRATQWHWVALPAVASLGLMAVFGNRMSAILGMLFVVLVFRDTWARLGKYRPIVACFAGVILVAVAVGGKALLTWIIGYAESLGISTYSLRTLEQTLDSGEISTAGRDVLFSQAISDFFERPIFGHGPTYFSSEHATYPHNLFLEVGVSFGMVGLICAILLIAKSVLRVMHAADLEYAFGVAVFVLGVVSLLVSKSFWESSYFWIFIAYGIGSASSVGRSERYTPRVLVT